MNLTEPEAGSDVGALRTKAVPADDGTYRITGTKIFITFGEHDMADNIVHLVLARTPGAPPGTKGISCFIVPKFLVNDDGSLGERNDVTCVSIEHKMGIKASPTCVHELRRGRRRRRLPHRRGEPGHALHVHDDEQRPPVGGARGPGPRRAGLPGRAAVRPGAPAGPAPGAPAGESSIDHRPPRRAPDAAHHEGVDRGHARRRSTSPPSAWTSPWPTPIPTSARPTGAGRPADPGRARRGRTDLGVEVTSLAIQIYGGMGYIEESGVAPALPRRPHHPDLRGHQRHPGHGPRRPQAAHAGRRAWSRTTSSMIATLDPALEKAGDELASIRSNLAEALTVLADTTGLAAAPRHRTIPATRWPAPRRTCGCSRSSPAAGSWPARRWRPRPSSTPATATPRQARAKLVTARFFAEQLLPAVKGLQSPVTAGSGDLFAVDAGPAGGLMLHVDRSAPSSRRSRARRRTRSRWADPPAGLRPDDRPRRVRRGRDLAPALAGPRRRSRRHLGHRHLGRARPG